MSSRSRLEELLSQIIDRQDVLSFLTLSYLAIVLVPAIVTALLLLLRVATPWAAAQLCLMATLSGLYWLFLHGLSNPQKWVVLGVFTASVLLAMVVPSFLYNVGWDGVTYHSEAILNLLHGVNPIYKEFEGNYPIWTNYYPKTEWYFAAAMDGTFGRLEMGKAYNIFLIYACGIYSWRFFRVLRLDRSASLLLAATAALNPIAASQVVSFYVDGAMASLLTMLVMSSVSLFRRPNRFDRTIFVAVSAAAVTTKYTGAAYVCVTIALVLMAQALIPLHDNWRARFGAIRSMLATTAILGMAVLLLGFSPYVTNVLKGRSPLYPVAGADKVVVVSAGDSGPSEFFRPNRNRFQNFAASFLAASSEAHGVESPRSKIPFTVHLAEIRASTNPDLRMAGWGVLFSGVFFASLGLYLYARGWRLFPEISFAILLALATSFSNPYGWWARYVPQIALVPILLLVPCFLSRPIVIKHLAKVIVVLILFNSLLLAVSATESASRGTWRANRSLENIYEQCGAGDYWFDGNTIPVRYDMLPVYRGVSIHFRRANPTELASGVSLPINLLKGRNDTVHIAHCANAIRP
jgi:hypothetical protein